MSILVRPAVLLRLLVAAVLLCLCIAWGVSKLHRVHLFFGSGLWIRLDDGLLEVEFKSRESFRGFEVVVVPERPEGRDWLTFGVGYENGSGLVMTAMWPFILGGALLEAMLLYRWLPRRRAKGVCAACGYNLTGNVSGICPECGTPVPQSGDAKPKESL